MGRVRLAIPCTLHSRSSITWISITLFPIVLTYPCKVSHHILPPYCKVEWACRDRFYSKYFLGFPSFPRRCYPPVMVSSCRGHQPPHAKTDSSVFLWSQWVKPGSGARKGWDLKQGIRDIDMSRAQQHQPHYTGAWHCCPVGQHGMKSFQSSNVIFLWWFYFIRYIHSKGS